jgi:hypothetical protein
MVEIKKKTKPAITCPGQQHNRILEKTLQIVVLYKEFLACYSMQ